MWKINSIRWWCWNIITDEGLKLTIGKVKLSVYRRVLFLLFLRCPFQGEGQGKHRYLERMTRFSNNHHQGRSWLTDWKITTKTQSGGEFVCNILQKMKTVWQTLYFFLNDTVMYGVCYPNRILFSILSSFFKLAFITTRVMVYGHYKTICITFFHNKSYNTM